MNEWGEVTEWIKQTFVGEPEVIGYRKASGKFADDYDYMLVLSNGFEVGYCGPQPRLVHLGGSYGGEECQHPNTERHVAWFTGTPSRRCVDCGMYLIEFDDEDDESGEEE